jgi:hypothetical protein
MNCGIEWTAKSWLKGPIEKGAKDGQQQYGDGIVKVLRTAVSGRPRGTTNASKVSKTARKKKRGEKRSKEGKVEETKKQVGNWGMFEPLRGPLQPVTDILGPVLNLQVLVALLSFIVLLTWLRGPRGTEVARYPGYGSKTDRFAAYDTLWSREEDEFWEWLEARANVDTILMREQSVEGRKKSKDDVKQYLATKQKGRGKALKGSKAEKRDVEAKLRQEKISQREMEDAVRITRERLEVLEGVIDRSKKANTAGKGSV